MIPNKETTRFLNRKWVKIKLINKILTDFHISKLNSFFTKHTCKTTENWHGAIINFILYDLTNYEGRIRRLANRRGQSAYTQYLRYGKDHFRQILAEQNKRKSKHFKNLISYWISEGYSNEEAIEKVSEVQKERNLKAVEKISGSSMYTVRSMSYWLSKGLTEEDAKNQVRNVQTKNGLSWYLKKYGEIEGKLKFENRIKNWLQALDNKSDDEKKIINLKKSASVKGRIACGRTPEEAVADYDSFCESQRNKPMLPWSKISQEFFSRLDEHLSGTTYYAMKNYEFLIGKYRVDFYHKETKTVDNRQF